jgi:hypothetical protein
MSKKSSPPLTRVRKKRPEARTVTLRVEAPAEVWAAARRRRGGRELEAWLAEIVPLLLLLWAEAPAHTPEARSWH